MMAIRVLVESEYATVLPERPNLSCQLGLDMTQRADPSLAADGDAGAT